LNKNKNMEFKVKPSNKNQMQYNNNKHYNNIKNTSLIIKITLNLTKASLKKNQ